jgi:acetyl-CoA acetyltransferase
MAVYGTAAEQLARIADGTRAWAAFNPKARYRDPITLDDVLARPWWSRRCTCSTAAW